MAKHDGTAIATCRGGGAVGLRLGVLPPSFFDSPNLYGRNEPVAGEATPNRNSNPKPNPNPNPNPHLYGRNEPVAGALLGLSAKP
eukprot:scaffold31662_cov40-Phaeocystis_antarctica.AAC.2